MIKTRWNPTINGALHVGHLYSMLVNERFAHEQGGKFCVRFDDNNPPFVLNIPLDRRQMILEEQYTCNSKRYSSRLWLWGPKK